MKTMRIRVSLLLAMALALTPLGSHAGALDINAKPQYFARFESVDEILPMPTPATTLELALSGVCIAAEVGNGIGQKSDDTVAAAGNDQCDVSDWRDIASPGDTDVGEESANDEYRYMRYTDRVEIVECLGSGWIGDINVPSSIENLPVTAIRERGKHDTAGKRNQYRGWGVWRLS